MRIARDMGDVSSVFPEGVTHLADMPHTWFDALRMALGFLSMDELPEDERPKREIWLEGDLMRQHWAMVKLKRDRQSGAKRDTGDIDGPVEENALMKEWGLR